MSAEKKGPEEEPAPTLMPLPRLVRVGQRTSRDSRIYTIETSEDGRTEEHHTWSVTTCLKTLDKPALPRWAAKIVAKEAIAQRAYLQQDVERYGEEDAAKRLADTPYRGKSRAAEIGTGVHALIDAHIRGTSTPNVDPELEAEILPRFEQFLRFEAAFAPTFAEDRTLAAEVTVFNIGHGWGGTLDILAELGTAGLGLIDVKNTNPGRDGGPGVYWEHCLQIAAYAHGEEIVPARGVWLPSVPMPKVNWGAVLWLHTDQYALVEVDISDDAYRTFRTAADLFRWYDGRSKGSVIGPQTPSRFGVYPTPEAQNAAIAGAERISEAQRRLLIATGAEKGLDIDGVRAIVESVTGGGSTTRLQVKNFEEVLRKIQGHPGPGGVDASATAPAGVESAGADSPGGSLHAVPPPEGD